jgi:TolB-like protein/class 3 adenylate cyclase
MTRKLTTILAADVAGYSRLMEADESGTLAALRVAREIFAKVIAAHRGRIFGGAGDSIVAEFGSAVEAVEAAIAIQSELTTDTAATAGLSFRIGINIGDVVIDGDDLLGDGVNVAARIEALAEPGGICISRGVFEQVRGKVDVAFESLGQQAVKNIAEPIAIYRVALDGQMRPVHVRWLAGFVQRRRIMGTIAWILVVAAGVLLWHVTQREPPRHGQLSLAVMPLTSLSADETTRRLADGLTEDIITDLSRFADLDIIASNSVAPYKDKADIVRAIGDDLGASYLLQGSIQPESERLRVSAQLISVPNGTVLWSQRWDRPTTDALIVQSELAEQVAAALGNAEASGAMTASEIRKARSRPNTSLSAYDLYLLAVEAMGKFTREARTFGLEAASKAIALDAEFARAYAIRARIRYNTTHDGADYEQVMQEMEADARKAVDLDPSGPEPRVALAWYYFNRGSYIDAEAELRAALKFNPANITVMKFAAAVFAWSGHPEQAAELADKVLRLDPLATAGTLMTIKDAYFFARRFEDAVAVISRAPAEARSKGARLFLPMSLAFLGRHDDASRARTELLEHYPNISAELLLNQGWVFEREVDRKLFLDGFAAIDVPLCASSEALAKMTKPKRLQQCSAQ